MASSGVQYCSSYHTRLPRPAVQFVLARFPRWQNRRDTAVARSFSHAWPPIRTACVCMHGLLACLFVCMLACSCRGDFQGRNPEIERMAQLWSVCFRRFCPSSECPCILFVTEQGSMGHTKSPPPFGLISLRDTGDSLCQMDLLQPVRRVIDIGSEIWIHRGHGLWLQTEIHYSGKHTDKT